MIAAETLTAAGDAMITHTIGLALPDPDTVLAEHRVDTAARHMYEAEIMLHCARQSHIDAWVVAAYERLHEAVLEHATALAERGRARRSA